MKKLSFAIASALLPFAAHAAPAEQRFTAGGTTFVYTTTVASNGIQIIDGREEGLGRRFHYVVNGRRVSGYLDGQPVTFNIPTPLSITQVIAVQ